jgi:hypothetical protein
MKLTPVQEKLKAVTIQWVDSSSNSGWNRPSDLDDTPALIRSAGFLVRRDRASVTISTSCGPRGGFIDSLTVPTSAVRSIRYLPLKSFPKKRSER